MLLTACKLQIKVLVSHVVNNVKEVESIVRETSAEQLGMMVTIDKKKLMSALGVPVLIADALRTSSYNSM